MATIMLERPEEAEGDETHVAVPAMWVICDACNGEGKSSAHLGTFTMTDLNEDPDFRDEYMAGRYDKPCQTCKGSGKVLMIDRDATMTPEQQAAVAEFDAREQARAELRRDEESERRHMYGPDC